MHCGCGHNVEVEYVEIKKKSILQTPNTSQGQGQT